MPPGPAAPCLVGALQGGELGPRPRCEPPGPGARHRVLIGAVAVAAGRLSAATRTGYVDFHRGSTADAAVRGCRRLGEDPPSGLGQVQPRLLGRPLRGLPLVLHRPMLPGSGHSTKQIDDAVAWGREAGSRCSSPTAGGPLARRRHPAGVVRPHHRPGAARCTETTTGSARCGRSELLAEMTGGELVVLHGSGHIPQSRDPVRLNHLHPRLRRAVRVAPGRDPHLVAVESPPQAGAVSVLADRTRGTRVAIWRSPPLCASAIPACASTGSPSIR